MCVCVRVCVCLYAQIPERDICSIQIARQILEAHASMLSLSAPDAKLQYIRNWQALQNFGVTYFIVKVGKSKKEVSLPAFHGDKIVVTASEMMRC